MSYRIARVAGGGASSPPCNARSLSLYTGQGAYSIVDLDLNPADGCLYVASEERHVIIRIDTRTQLATVAAGVWGVSGFSGDSGSAMEAHLNSPSGVCFDATGDMYISDSGNRRIRRVDATSRFITTIAGTGTAGNSGDGGQATSAQFEYPISVATYGDYLWISDLGGSRVRCVTLSSGVINLLTSAGAPFKIMSIEDGRYFFVLGTMMYMGTGNGVASPYGGSPAAHGGYGGCRNMVYLQAYAYVSDTDTAFGGKISFVSLNGSAVSPGGTDATSGTFDSAFPSDGSDISTPVPATAKVAGMTRLVYDGSGVCYVGTPFYVYKAVRATPEAVSLFQGAALSATDVPGFDDSDAITVIRNGVGYPYPVTSPATGGVFTDENNFRGKYSSNVYGSLIVVGSSFSNVDYATIENNDALMNSLMHGFLVGGADFKNKGGGDGSAFGDLAQKIHVWNDNGSFLVERWLNGSTVVDYGLLLLKGYQNNWATVLVAGIRDISTKAAAFVLANKSNVAFSATFAMHPGFLVRCTYPVTVSTPGMFIPSTSNITLIPLNSVTNLHP
jgi:hypothetical protein